MTYRGHQCRYLQTVPLARGVNLFVRHVAFLLNVTTALRNVRLCAQIGEGAVARRSKIRAINSLLIVSS